MILKSIVLFATVALLTGCSGGGGDSAGDAVIRQLGYLDKGQYGRSWEEIHPAQQAFITRDAYLTCRADANLPGISNIKILETYIEPVDIPGTDQHVDSTAVTISFKASAGGKSETTKLTVHEVKVDGEWKWLVSGAEAYKKGQCP